MNPFCNAFVSALLLVPVVCSSAPIGSPSSGSDSSATASASGGTVKLAKAPQQGVTAFQHIVIIFQENRTPDNLFHDPVLRFS